MRGKSNQIGNTCRIDWAFQSIISISDQLELAIQSSWEYTYGSKKVCTASIKFDMKLLPFGKEYLHSKFINLTDISKKTFKAPVNVSRACITIQAGYVCVVRSGTAQDQAYHLPPNVCHGPKTSGS